MTDTAMTDTAIPIPDDLHTVMMPRVEAARAAVRRAWAPVIEEMERAAAAAGRTLQRSMERSAQRRRVRNLMPKLAMQEVLVHGYTPYKEAWRAAV